MKIIRFLFFILTIILVLAGINCYSRNSKKTNNNVQINKPQLIFKKYNSSSSKEYLSNILPNNKLSDNEKYGKNGVSIRSRERRMLSNNSNSVLSPINSTEVSMENRRFIISSDKRKKTL